MPVAPSVNLFYEFLGGKAPGAAATPEQTGGGGELDDLLDQADKDLDLDFNPNEIQVDSSKLDIDVKDLDMDSDSFKELTKEQLAQLPMAEQLQYQRKLNEWKASKKAEGGDAGGGAKANATEEGGFKELTPAELGRLPLAEQLQYQRKFNEWKNEQKAKQAESGGDKGGDKAGGDGGFKELSVDELKRLSMAEQLQYQRKLNEWKAEQKKKQEEASSGGAAAKKDGDFKELTIDELKKLSMAEQL